LLVIPNAHSCRFVLLDHHTAVATDLADKGSVDLSRLVREQHAAGRCDRAPHVDEVL